MYLLTHCGVAEHGLQTIFTSMAKMEYTIVCTPSGSCMGTTNKTDVQTDVQNVPVDTMMDQLLLILYILR